jgi:hypothetical protein
MTCNANSSILEGCAVMPPMDTAEESMPRPASKESKAKGKSNGRFQAINAFADFTLAALNRAEIAVWLLLWRDTKPTGLAHTSQTDLARRAGCSDRQVRRALGSLAGQRLLPVVYQGGLNRGSSVYRVRPLTESA